MVTLGPGARVLIALTPIPLVKNSLNIRALTDEATVYIHIFYRSHRIDRRRRLYTNCKYRTEQNRYDW